MSGLTRGSKTLLAAVVAICAGAAIYKRWDRLSPGLFPAQSGRLAPAAEVAATSGPPRAPAITVALCSWPGHMPLLVANGGLTTQPGSAAAAEGIDLRIVFLEDPPSKNRALIAREVDLVWQTVDELPVSLGTFKEAGLDVRAFLQLDWSRGGDACVATREVRSVEHLLGRKSALLRFSPEHTLFEFMLGNSLLTPEQVVRVRRDTSFSPDDPAFALKLFIEGKVDLACVWEPDVTLALAARPGAHRLFSTADATDLIADVLLGQREFFERRGELAEKVARVWFAGVAASEADRKAAARLVATVVPRFRDELGYARTLRSFAWVRWTGLAENVGFFGLDGRPAAFDRVYQVADAIWKSDAGAALKQRFEPQDLRDDAVVRRMWEGANRPAAEQRESYPSDVARTGSPIFTKPLTVTFDSSEFSLDAQSRTILNQHLLPQVLVARGMLIRVEGNTDNVGNPETNRKLSERRAQAIVDYLISRGVHPSRLVAQGNGSTRPLASNKTIDGRARNRRTEILFIPAARAALEAM